MKKGNGKNAEEAEAVEAASPFGDDHLLVERLIATDDNAWRWLLSEVVYPLFRGNIRGIRDMCSRHGVTETAVASRLYRTLSRDGFAPLRNFRFKCSFRSWIYWYVWDSATGALREVVGKHDREVSDSEVLESLTDTKAPSSGKSLERRETADAMNGMLARLWKENPSRAMILLLRGDLGLSSKEVGAFLNKEPSNVDQIFHRAQSAMRKIRAAEEER